MSMWRMPYSDSASTSAFITEGSAPAQPASPQPFAPRTLVVAGTGWNSWVNSGRVLGPWQCVVHVGAGQQLAVLVIDRVLAQRLADALHDPAMRLAIDQQRVDDRAEIIDESIADDLDHAGLGVDLDLGDVAAIGEGRGRAVGDQLRHRGSAAVPAAVPGRSGACRPIP